MEIREDGQSVLKMRIFIVLLINLIAGIIVGSFVQWNISLQFVLLGLVGILLVLVGIRNRGSGQFISDKLLLIILFISSMLVMSLQMPKQHELEIKEGDFVAEVISIPMNTEKQLRCLMQVKSASDRKMERDINLRVLGVFWRDSSDNLELHIGDKVQVTGKLKTMPPAYNPHQFDYSQFMRNKAVYYSLEGQVSKMNLYAKGGVWDFLRLTKGWQQQFVHKFSNYIKDKDALNMASAIVLGYRTNFPSELTKIFSGTGTIHVLSISGMHIGVVFGFLMFCLGFMHRLPKGHVMQIIVILLLVWIYSSIAGFAAPVLRAAIMITLISFGRLQNKFIFSTNILAATAFFILLFDPHMLFDIGFQLSFTAVLGITLFYPILSEWISTTNSFFIPVQKAVLVCISAQILTTPLTLYYFNQFPVYFLVANLFISIPSTLLVWAGGALMISPIEDVNNGLGLFMEYTLKWSVAVLAWIETWPFAVIKSTFMSLLLVAGSYITLLLILSAAYHRMKSYVILGLMGLLFIIVYALFQRIHDMRYIGLHIYNVQRNIAFSYIQEGEVLVFANKDSIQDKSLQYAISADLDHYADKINQQFVSLNDIQKSPIYIGIDPRIQVHVGDLESHDLQIP